MDLDDDVCLCFHVKKRKLVSYLRVERPSRVSQLSECQGAGTGCGWCRPFLQRLFDQARDHTETADADLSAAAYAEARAAYIRDGKGTPPG